MHFSRFPSQNFSKSPLDTSLPRSSFESFVLTLISLTDFIFLGRCKNMQLIVFDEFPEDRVFPIKELVNRIKYWQCPVKGAFPGSCETGKYGDTLAAARLPVSQLPWSQGGCFKGYHSWKDRDRSRPTYNAQTCTVLMKFSSSS